MSVKLFPSACAAARLFFGCGRGEEAAEIDLDAAFVCSGPYVEGHDTFGLEIMAGISIDRFVTGEDRSYDSIRAMKRFQAGHSDPAGAE